MRGILSRWAGTSLAAGLWGETTSAATALAVRGAGIPISLSSASAQQWQAPLLHQAAATTAAAAFCSSTGLSFALSNAQQASPLGSTVPGHELPSAGLQTADAQQASPLGGTAQPEFSSFTPEPGSSAHTAGASADDSASGTDADADQSTDEQEEEPTADEEVFELIPSAERQQRELSNEESRFLWGRAEEQARLHHLIKLRVGKGGLSKGLLANIGDLLAAHELIRVYLSEASKVESGFAKFVMEGCLDCVVIKAKGNSLTLFRETGLPRPHSFARASDSAEAPAESDGTTAASSKPQRIRMPTAKVSLKKFMPHKQKYKPTGKPRGR